MKSYQLMGGFLTALFVFTGCSNDETAQEYLHPEPEGVTEFISSENTAKPPIATRAMGIYTGSGISFYWTPGDNLWIKNPAFSQSVGADIADRIAASGNGRTDMAKFYFQGTYTEPSYSLRYTGTGNTASDKVTIKALQNQQEPNDAVHLGTDGDCGTATAFRQADGSYQFALDHKAAYLTFMPYYSTGFTEDVRVTQIKVTADQPMAGTYDFNDNGLDTTVPASASNSIILTLNGGGTDGFSIPSAQSYAQNASIMVIAPGTYSNFTVEYTLYDRVTNVTATVSKNYGDITCASGKNKKVASNLDVINRGDKLYMWDAKQDYWYGYESEQPVVNQESNANYPKSKANDPMRWYNDIKISSGKAVSATGRGAVCPNDKAPCAKRSVATWGSLV